MQQDLNPKSSTTKGKNLENPKDTPTKGEEEVSNATKIGETSNEKYMDIDNIMLSPMLEASKEKYPFTIPKKQNEFTPLDLSKGNKL